MRSKTLKASSIALSFAFLHFAPAHVSASSKPSLRDSSPPAGLVAVNDSRLIWSPYNWRFNKAQWAETMVGGAYIKVAFTGSTLSLHIDTTANTGADLNAITINTYVDGATNPIVLSLSRIPDGLLQISSSLSSKKHYAVIYLAHLAGTGMANRWDAPVNMLRIKSIQLANDGTGNVLSLSKTPFENKHNKVVFFGDSITEGFAGVSAPEREFPALLGQKLGVEYGQIGYGTLGWTYHGNGNTAYFYDLSAPADSLWRNYDASHSRIVDNTNLSSGFVDGAPDAVFINLGTNDANANTGASILQTKVTTWLSDIRQTIGPHPAIFVISPFCFGNAGNSTYAAYKSALFQGVKEYQSTHASDSRVYSLDLRATGYSILMANSPDGLHPNDAGAIMLSNLLAKLAGPYVIAPSREKSKHSISPMNVK